ncbi:MAG: phosphatidylserine/phosphatidylglycerophosphate/cardiolipin synthase family protein [Elusimicrobiota bacterium]
MRKTHILTLIAALSVSLQAQTKPNIETRIKRTAQEMGISVYEELPAGKSSFESLNTASPFADGFVITDKNPQNLGVIPEPSLNSSTLPKPPSLSFSEQTNVYWGYAVTLWNSLSAQISDSGVFSSGAPSFEDISKKLLTRTQSSVKPSGKSLFEEENFLREFEKIAGSNFTSGNKVKYLIDGEESFKYKDYLIKNAKKSVYVTTWAFYDDITGEDALNMLVEAKNRGVDVKIILDAKIINSHGVSVVKRMEKAGLQLLKFRESGRPADIWHVKMIIVDGEYVIMGGMNFGDPYSHKDPAGLKWRDTDVLIMGPAVAKAQEFFAKIWNGESDKNGLNLPRMAQSYQEGPAVGNAKVSLSYSNPPAAEGTEILTAIIKAIRGAQKKINIENAYFVPIPALTQVLLEARNRGVEVNIFTNSKDSIDPEAKSVSDISMKSMLPLFKAGANIYLKKGDTLHSKFMTVDETFVSIGSYNLHPRGERYDSELNANIIDKETALSLDKTFEKDINTLAVKVTSDKQLVPDQSWFSSIIEKYFFAQLSRK